VIAVEVENVSKRFRRQTVQPYTTLKSAVVDFVLRRRRLAGEGTFQALQRISFTVQQGQTFGIIGRNGSGKSTLLKLLARIYRPDIGRIAVHGKVGALLELGAGFHPEFSGRENILINGIVLGLSKREVRQRFEAIIRFSELEAFIDAPLKTYSSGMYMRLGFAVAVYADPDILLIDEFLSVGDEAFQQKCFDKIAEFQRQGKTIVLVTHDLATVDRWCDEALWLDDGLIQGRGKPRSVIDMYHEGIVGREAATSTAPQRIEEEVREAAAETPNRRGSQEMEIVSVRMLDSSNQERYIYCSGEQMRLAIRYKVHRHVAEPVFGIMIIRRDGVRCYGTNTWIEGIPIRSLGEEGTVEVLLERMDLIAGTYYLDVAVHSRDGSPYDYHHWLYSFKVKSELGDVGVFRIPHQWAIKP
jgi:ABC-type polysaccharide/polyol phosphate transport system ATPase subunit